MVFLCNYLSHLQTPRTKTTFSEVFSTLYDPNYRHLFSGLLPSRYAKCPSPVIYYIHIVEEGPSLHNADYQISNFISPLAVANTKYLIYIDIFAFIDI